MFDDVDSYLMKHSVYVRSSMFKDTVRGSFWKNVARVKWNKDTDMAAFFHRLNVFANWTGRRWSITRYVFHESLHRPKDSVSYIGLCSWYNWILISLFQYLHRFCAYIFVVVNLNKYFFEKWFPWRTWSSWGFET